MRATLGGVAIAALGLLGSAALAGSDVAYPPAAGMRATVDPRTGALVPDPGDEAVAAPGANPSFSTSMEGLTVVPAPGGGVMLDLHGRFATAITATVGPDGDVRTDCRTGTSSAR